MGRKEKKERIGKRKGDEYERGMNMKEKEG